MNKLKIVTIGGGSSYTPELIEGFIKRYDTFPLTELWLVDIEDGKEKLDIVANLAERMVEKSGLPIKIHRTLNRREALTEADFVTTQFRVGLLDARIKDERIPLRYGMLGQETNGAGGMAKAMRTIPVILGICKDMEELCPEAWLINFTNPSGMVTESVINNSKIKVAGLCNVPVGMKYELSEVMGVKNHETASIKAAGLNHFFWCFDYSTPEFTTTFPEVMDKYLDQGVKTEVNIQNLPWVEEQIRNLNAIPCNYFKYYYNTDEMLRHQIEEIHTGKGCRGEQVKKVEESLFELYKDPNLAIKPKELEQRGGKFYSDAACELINSIHNDAGKEIVVSRPNMYQGKKIISCLPENAAVEVTCNIHKDDLVPYATEIEMPLSIRGFLQNQKAFEQLVIRGSINGDRGDILQAMAINHLIVSGEVTRVILDDLIEAHKKYLPKFHK